MSTNTKTRPGRRSTRRGPSQATQDRQAAVELAITTIGDDTPDYAAFRARWGDRYAEANLARLWVQCPHATALHFLPTWRHLGRRVRAGEHAIWLKLPRNSHDETKITEANPTGAVFSGASWSALFDLSQTCETGDWTEDAPEADPDTLAEVRRLRAEALKLHPDVTGESGQAADRAFSAAWLAYETARDRLGGAS